MNELIEQKHFYFNEAGLMILTEQFHLEKGFCCGLGCLHCPYGHINVPQQQGETSESNNKSKKDNYNL